MRNLVVPIRFRFAKPAPVSTRYTNYYGKLAPHVFGDIYRRNDLQLRCSDVLAIASEHAIAETEVANRLLDAIGNDSYDAVLIDLGGVEEDDVPRHNVLLGLVLAVNKLLERDSTTRIAALMPLPLSAEDVVAPTLRRTAEDTRFRIIFGSGDGWGAHFSLNPPPRATINSIFREARRSPLETIERKLIRHVGQYALPGSPQIIRYFYDCQKATDATIDLVTEWLTKRKNAGAVSRIFYDTRHSQWFRVAVEACLRESQLLEISKEIVDDAALSNLTNSDLILLPFVRTGRSLEKMIGGAFMADSAPHVYTVLSTAGQRKTDGQRPVQVSTALGQVTSLAVTYSLKVPSEPNGHDPLLWQSAPVPQIDPNASDLADKFSADAMWGMILEAGMVPEFPVPKRRLPIGYVPNFGRVCELNGQFIAAKVEAILKRTYGASLAHNLAFLCPEEPHAQKVAEALRDLAGHDTVHVLRSLIDFYHDNPSAEIADFGAAEDEKARVSLVQDQLLAWRELSATVLQQDRPQVVLLDEFDVSGGTLMGLRNLANKFGLDVLCSISLADLGPPRQEDPVVQHIALYEINYRAVRSFESATQSGNKGAP